MMHDAIVIAGAALIVTGWCLLAGWLIQKDSRPGGDTVNVPGLANPPARSGTTTSDPGRWLGLTPVTTAPCPAAIPVKGDSPGSEACEPCTVHGCGEGCKCACHWGEPDAAAEKAWAALTAEPGWGEPDDGLDLDALGFATEEFLIRAERILGPAVSA